MTEENIELSLDDMNGICSNVDITNSMKKAELNHFDEHIALDETMQE